MSASDRKSIIDLLIDIKYAGMEYINDIDNEIEKAMQYLNSLNDKQLIDVYIDVMEL